MNSLEVYSFKANIKEYVNKSALPKEVVRLVFAELLREIEKQAIEEVYAGAKEREENGIQ